MSPLHNERFEIEMDLVKNCRIKTGDIFFRIGDESYFGLPFSKLVARVTNSKYSHASVAVVEAGQIYLIEISLPGTVKLRLIDWLDFCGTDFFEVWRMKPSKGIYTEERLLRSINEFLGNDADYDLFFDSNNKKFYCTESVVEIYNNAGYPHLCCGNMASEILPWWKYHFLFRPINWLMGKLCGASIPTTLPLIFVGNKDAGLMSSQYLEKVYGYNI